MNRQREASKSFGRTVKRAAEDLGISLRQVAQKAEMDPSFLSRIVTGERNPPSDDLIIRLAEVLDVPPNVLLIEAGRIPPDVSTAARESLPDFFRATRDLSEEDIRAVIRAIESFRGGKRDE